MKSTCGRRATFLRRDIASGVEITSSNFPYADRNLNAFIDLSRATEKDFVMASQTIYHDAEHPSHVELPIIPQARARKWVETPFPRAADMPARR
jgi:uncharacterized protein